MTLKVKAYHNRFRPASIGLVFSKSVSKRVCFDYSCRYDLKTNDQLDINKLFGVGYWPHHHRESARFGWRWNLDKGRMDILAYVYSRGQRIEQFICDVRLGEFNNYHLFTGKDKYIFVVTDGWRFNRSVTIPVAKHTIAVGYRLGAYFGGNLPAPHEMIIIAK